MKKIKRLDLRLEKEVISALTTNDLSGLQGGGVTTQGSSAPYYCCIATYVITDCNLCTNTCNQTECQKCDMETIKTCFKPITDQPGSCPCELITKDLRTCIIVGPV